MESIEIREINQEKGKNEIKTGWKQVRNKVLQEKTF